MTREEAIEELERLLSHWDDLENGKRSFRWYSKDAVEVALSALRPVSREQVEEWRGVWAPYTNWWEFRCSICRGRICKSCTDASRKTGANRSHIGQCALGKRKTAGGLHWTWRGPQKEE